jgi:hypothetical protein
MPPSHQRMVLLLHPAHACLVTRCRPLYMHQRTQARSAPRHGLFLPHPLPLYLACPLSPLPRFFQSQIRSEEEFQARKAELRASARERLDEIFHAKGKRLVIDSDEEFSIGSSELSAWDSDVASISSLSSCVREWRQEAHFGAPAEAMLQIALVCLVVGGQGSSEEPHPRCPPLPPPCNHSATCSIGQPAAFLQPPIMPTLPRLVRAPCHPQAVALHTCWASFQAVAAVNRFWGVIRHGWTSYASFVTSAVLAATAAGCWLVLGRSGKRCLLGFQIGLQLLYVATTTLAVLGYLIPGAIDEDVSTTRWLLDAQMGRLFTSKLRGWAPVCC